MVTEVVLAVAGGRKTQLIADKVSRMEATAGSVVLTFTRNGQRELEERVAQSSVRLLLPEIIGWYSFLISHIVRPYLPAVFEDVQVTGLHFVESADEIPKFAKGSARYFDSAGRVYSNRLSLLCNNILEATSDAPMRRIEGIYDSIFIDEVQDLGGNDLDILERLMQSDVNVCMVGDVRQSVLSTSKSDTKNTQFKYASMMEWFRQKQDLGLCQIVESNTTWRFNSKIARFSDLIHDEKYEFSPTESLNDEITDHDGVFLVSESELGDYMNLYAPTVLRYNVRRRSPDGAEVFTFKSSKGITRDRIAILATKPIIELLTKNSKLKHTSACEVYVAATRARSSVAIVVPDASQVENSLHPRMAGSVVRWSSSMDSALF